VVSLGHDIIAAQWCTGSMCHLTRLYLGGTGPGSDQAYLNLLDDVPLPRCPASSNADRLARTPRI